MTPPWLRIRHSVNSIHFIECGYAKVPEKIKSEAKKKADVICISALSGEGLDDFSNAVKEKLKDMMVWVEALIPFDKGELLSTIHHLGLLEKTEYIENGALVRAHFPLRFARCLTPVRPCVSIFQGFLNSI
ncbi:UNVERIFIED_CONTAM: hypothetical protein Sradi_4301400 [Sesamum radiatum]|uniref:HflX C-terminal domain-containing protein n=1 Tax=Sesamum radiatum TaxID=300843 RepID=A0AAW2NN23_SESRA